MGKVPILTNIFQLGWNHQLDTYSTRKNDDWKDDLVFFSGRKPIFRGELLVLGRLGIARDIVHRFFVLQRGFCFFRAGFSFRFVFLLDMSWIRGAQKWIPSIQVKSRAVTYGSYNIASVTGIWVGAIFRKHLVEPFSPVCLWSHSYTVWLMQFWAVQVFCREGGLALCSVRDFWPQLLEPLPVEPVLKGASLEFSLQNLWTYAAYAIHKMGNPMKPYCRIAPVSVMLLWKPMFAILEWNKNYSKVDMWNIRLAFCGERFVSWEAFRGKTQHFVV